MTITADLDATHHCLCGRDTTSDGKWGAILFDYHLEEGAVTQREADAVLRAVNVLEGHRLCWNDFITLLKLVDQFRISLEQNDDREPYIPFPIHLQACRHS